MGALSPDMPVHVVQLTWQWIWVQGGDEKEDDPEEIRTQGAALVEAQDICKLEDPR